MMVSTHEIGCPYLTAAGGMGQCICGAAKAFALFIGLRSDVKPDGTEEKKLRDAFYAGWQAARTPLTTFTTTHTAYGQVVFGPTFGPGGIPLGDK
jgi:hypothetical protein